MPDCDLSAVSLSVHLTVVTAAGVVLVLPHSIDEEGEAEGWGGDLPKATRLV